VGKKDSKGKGMKKVLKFFSANIDINRPNNYLYSKMIYGKQKQVVRN